MRRPVGGRSTRRPVDLSGHGVIGYHETMDGAPSSAASGLARRLAERALAKRLIVATAESCTGGWVAQVLTSLPGSSAWFDAGFVAYSNEAKRRLLGVPAALFAPGAPGAVSEEAVRAMTAGALANSRANLAAAVSGIAGPDGGSAEKPVGTVWVGWQWEDRSLARRFRFGGDRRAVRLAAVEAAIKGLLALADRGRVG